MERSWDIGVTLARLGEPQGALVMKPMFVLALTALTSQLSSLAAQSVDSQRVAALAGCWAVKVGTFQGSRVDSGMTTLPTMVRLDTLPGKDFMGDRSGWLVLGHPRANGSMYREGSFAPVGRDSVRLSWSTGFVGLTIEARATAQQMDGVAIAWTDYSGQQQAPIMLLRSTCP